MEKAGAGGRAPISHARGDGDASHPPESLKFPVHGPLETLIKHPAADIGIAIDIIDRFSRPGGVSSHGLSGLTFNMFEIEASLFVANYAEWIKDRHSTDYHSWPPVWNFGRVVRNAISHGGTINIASPTAPRVEWRGVTFSHCDRGTAIRTRMAPGDFFMLMVDMEAELNRLGAPFEPYTT